MAPKPPARNLRVSEEQKQKQKKQKKKTTAKFHMFITRDTRLVITAMTTVVSKATGATNKQY